MFKWEERAVQRLPPLSYFHPFPGMDSWSWTQTAQRPPHPYPLLRSSPTPRVSNVLHIWNILVFFSEAYIPSGFNSGDLFYPTLCHL